MPVETEEAAGFSAIFGAAGGIGLAVARRFAAEGRNLALADRDPQVMAAIAADLVEEFDIRAVGSGYDARDRLAVRSMLEQASSEFGRLQSVVDLIGIAPFGGFLEISDDEWQAGLEINLTSAFVIGQESARLMKDTGGSLVFMSSTSAHIAHSGQAVYSVSKSGIEALVRAMAVDLGPYGIRVNAIAPGTIMTPLNLQAVSDDGRRERLARIPLDRFGSPEDAAAVAHFLASDDAAFVSGTSIRLDGGFMISGILSKSGPRTGG